MATPHTLSGVGAVFRPDGTRLDGARRYSFTFLPFEIPTFTCATVQRPATVGCFVELRGSEPLELEGERLVVVTADGHRVRFHLFDVSETPPHCHTTIVEGWPELTGADVRVTIASQQKTVGA